MALEDINQGRTYCWYDAAEGRLDKIVSSTSNDFGAGKENTEYVMDKWKNESWGAQDDNGTYDDMWGSIETEVSQGWLVPSKSEWAAFGAELGITSSNYINKGLTGDYWTSSQYDISGVYQTLIDDGGMYALLYRNWILCSFMHYFLIKK